MIMGGKEVGLVMVMDRCSVEGSGFTGGQWQQILKLEREEFVLRCQLALKQYDKVLRDSAGEDKTPGVCVCLCLFTLTVPV